MNKKLLLGVPLLALSVIASLGTKTNGAQALRSYDFFPEQNTVLTRIYSGYEKSGDTLVKKPIEKTVYERYDDRSIKSESTYLFDENKNDFALYEKFEYTYDSQGNILTLKMYSNSSGELKYDGGYFYTYENGKITLMSEHNSKDEECAKDVYTYTATSMNEKSYQKSGDSDTLVTERTYTYNASGKALTRHFIYYSLGSITRQSMIEWTYDDQNRVTREEEKFYNASMEEDPYDRDLTDFTYGDGVRNEIFSRWVNNEYVLDDKNVYTINGTVATEEHYDYVSENQWSFQSCTKETATIDENGFRTKIVIETNDDENTTFEVFAEYEYTHMELPKEDVEQPVEKKSSAVGIIFGILGGLILIICGLFAAWKIEVKKKGIESEKRVLKFLDKVCKPIDKVLFPVKTAENK